MVNRRHQVCVVHCTKILINAIALLLLQLTLLSFSDAALASHASECETLRLQLKCGGIGKQIVSITEIQFSSLHFDANQLDLSDNILESIHQNTFYNFTSLLKLNLSRNVLEFIEKGAFTNLRLLKRLDLSRNKLKSVYDIFGGLPKLERLKLNQNLFSTIAEGTFSELTSLNRLDLSQNPWACSSCNILWLLDWVSSKNIKLVPAPACRSPASLAGQPMNKLKHDSFDLQCKRPTILGKLEMSPTKSQVVFEGDSLSLYCRAPVVKPFPLTWIWEEKAASSVFDDVHIREETSQERGVIESWLHIKHLWKNHTGQWYCNFVSVQGNQSQAISVIVISNYTKYCTQTVSYDSKGVYVWPKTVQGFTAELICEGEPLGSRYAYRSCTQDGDWSVMNATSCPYVSETTKILEQFAKMNLSLSKGTILESAKRLKNFTGDGKQLKDKTDVLFTTKTIENYLGFLNSEKELGPILVDVVGSILRVPREVLVSAELDNRACSRLVRAIEFTAENTPLIQAHKSSIAVEEFNVKRDTFAGLTCTWYSQSDGGRLFHCSNSNATGLLGSKSKVIEASVQVPTSLYYQLEHQGITTVNARQLVVTMYENNRLFPKMNVSDELDVTSAIVGVKLVGIDVANLTDPVYIILRAPLLHYSAGSPKPVWWDEHLNNDTGGWNSHGCQLSHLLDGLLVFQCNRLGYFGLLQRTDYLLDESRRLFGMKFRFSHPAIYIGSFIAVITSLSAIVSFIVCHSSIHMSKKTKHSLVNTWIAIALLCFLYAIGIHQTEDVRVCQCIGLTLHYLTLSVLLWMAVSVSNMYKRLTKSNSLHPPDDELPSEQPSAQKPILGLYLVGWGIGLIICGISGAVNIREYAGHTHCFLTLGPAMSAVFVPAAMLAMYLTVFYLLIRCTVQNLDSNGQLSEGTQATENVDIDLIDSGVGVNNLAAERVSLHSVSTPTASSEVEDVEFSPKTQLNAHVIILILFLLMWSAAAISTTMPFNFPHEGAIFSIVFAVLASCLGGFILFFYCIARSDVREEWYLMRCWCRRKQGRCCRTRSISDTNPGPPATQPVPANILVLAAAPNLVASRLSVNNSLSHHTDKTASTNKSINASKAAVELNIRAVRADLALEGKSNVNLVVLHRQQYRSNNSVTTYTEASGTSGAEMFYNPHQSTTARKFFRKQRRHLKQNNLGRRRSGDGGGADTDSNRPKSASDMIPGIYNHNGSKVNNTNIHVESCASESRPNNPNMLVDNCNHDVEKDVPMERLVIGAEEREVSISNKVNMEALSTHADNNIEYVESEAELASLAAEFQAIREEITQNRVRTTNGQNRSPSISSDEFIGGSRNEAHGTLCSLETCDTSDKYSFTMNSEVTIPETCSFISNSDSRMSSVDIDSDSVDRFHNESLLSLNEMENEDVDIGVSSPEMAHVKFQKDDFVRDNLDHRYCNNSPVSDDAVVLESKDFQTLPNGKKQETSV